MITISELTPNVQQIKISGKVQSADMPQVIDLAEMIGKGGKKDSLVFDIENVEGFDWSVLGEEMSHLSTMMRMLTRLDRIAVIADQSWLRTAARLESALLPGVTYEVFSRDKAEQARAWAKGKDFVGHTWRQLDRGIRTRWPDRRGQCCDDDQGRQTSSGKNRRPTDDGTD